MSESRREEERRRSLGPDIDDEGRRMDEPRAGTERHRHSESRGDDGPRRAGGSGEERGSGETQRRGDGDSGRGTSWVSVVIGWLTALGASLILGGIVGAIVGAILGTGTNAATEGGTAGLIGLLITLLLAFIVGGYTAGRMASRSGVKHGLLVPVLALVVTIVLAGIGTLLGLSFVENLSGVTLPAVPNDAPQSLGTILTVTGILALLAPFIGGAIGGALGARTGRRRP